MTDEQRAELLEMYPEAVMRMEGLPADVRADAEARFARERLDDVAISTAAAFLEAEVDIATFEVEGAARGEYRVMGDGSVQLHLRLEGDLGREFGTAAGEAEVEVGVSGEVLIAFDSAEEADAFLAGLFPASTEGFGAPDALPWNVGDIPARFGGNVYDYVMSEDVRDLRGSVYAGGSIEFEGGRSTSKPPPRSRASTTSPPRNGDCARRPRSMRRSSVPPRASRSAAPAPRSPGNWSWATATSSRA